MTILSAVARVEDPRVRKTLSALAGVEALSTGDPRRVAVLVESGDLDEAHHILTEVVARAEGVLAVWPVYMNDEEYAISE